MALLYIDAPSNKSTIFLDESIDDLREDSMARKDVGYFWNFGRTFSTGMIWRIDSVSKSSWMCDSGTTVVALGFCTLFVWTIGRRVALFLGSSHYLAHQLVIVVIGKLGMMMMQTGLTFGMKWLLRVRPPLRESTAQSCHHRGAHKNSLADRAHRESACCSFFYPEKRTWLQLDPVD